MKRLPVAAAWVFVALTPTLARGKPPTLNALEPAGARQGTIVRVRAAGSFDTWPPRCWSSGGGVSVEPASEKGVLWIQVAENAAPGLRWIRLADREGASALRPFVVGLIPERSEREPNDDPAKAQAVDRLPVTINGKLARNGDVDGFALTLEHGQTLVASMEANRRLGSPMDGVLQVVRPDGIVVAQNDDDHDRDPQVVFRPPTSGVWIVRVFAFPATPDSRIGFSGGDTYLYRLTLSNGGFADHVTPLAIEKGKPGTLAAEGWNLANPGPKLEVALDPSSAATTSTAFARGLANQPEVRVVSHPVLLEAEPNPLDHAQPIKPPVSVSGRIESGTDVDVFQFTAKKGEKYQIRVESRSLGQPLDATLRVVDASGNGQAEIDDANNGRDPSLNFTAPADGPFRIVVRDLQREGGPRAVYLLTVTPATPGFTLTVAGDRFTVDPKKPLSLPVTITRANGYDAPIEVKATGLPAGLSADPVVSEPKGASAKTVNLVVKVAEGSKPDGGPFQVVASPRAASKDVAPTLAEAKLDGLDSTTAHLWIHVAPPK